MIPARRKGESGLQPAQLDITARLQRLRYEQRNHPQQLPPRQSPARPGSTPTSQPASLHPAFAHLSLGPPPEPEPESELASSSTGTSRRRGTAGPSAPASWLTAERESPEQQAGRRREARRRALVPLEDGERWLVPRPRRVPTLAEFCGRAIAVDLARGRQASLLLEYVRWLPARMRLPVLDLAPDKVEVGLGQAAIRELLSEEETEEAWVEGDEGGGNDSADAAKDLATMQPGPPSHDDRDWDSILISNPVLTATIAAALTQLNLSLSTLTHTTLAALLLSNPASPSAPAVHLAPASSATIPRPTSRFPHLVRLSLTACPRLALSEPLLDTLAPLFSLRHLALACLPLGDTLTPSTALPKLAAATPTLESVDLSFVEGLSGAVLRNVNWDLRWRELRVVGWRRWMFVADGADRGKEASRERKGEVARELWGVVRGARKEQGRFVKFFT